MCPKPSYQALEQRIAELEESLCLCQLLTAGSGRSEDICRTLIDQVNVGIYRSSVGPAGVILQANLAMAKMFGYDSVAEFMKVPVADFYLCPDERRLFIEKISRHGLVKERDLRLKKKDGSLIWAAGTARTRVDEQGRILWIEGFIEDITERKEAEERIRQNYYSEKLSALGRMTANIAHEIRNPLTVLGGLAKRLDKRMIAGSKEKEYTQVMVAEASRLEKILLGILCFSKEANLDRRYCLLDRIVAESLRMLAVLCEERAITIRTNLDPLPPLYIDPDRTREVIDNLLFNAIEAIPGQGEITIRTGSDRLEDTLFRTVRISDSGVGMSEEEVSRIFEPFYTTKAVGNGKGIGLGLAICKKIMEEHQGAIKVESRPGEGATFMLYFPVEGPPAVNF